MFDILDKASCVDDDLSTWKMRDLLLEKESLISDEAHGFGDDEALEKITNEINRRKKA